MNESHIQIVRIINEKIYTNKKKNKTFLKCQLHIYININTYVNNCRVFLECRYLPSINTK